MLLLTPALPRCGRNGCCSPRTHQDLQRGPKPLRGDGAHLHGCSLRPLFQTEPEPTKSGQGGRPHLRDTHRTLLSSLGHSAFAPSAAGTQQSNHFNNKKQRMKHGHGGYTSCQVGHLQEVAQKYHMAKQKPAAKGTPEPAGHQRELGALCPPLNPTTSPSAGGYLPKR